MRGCAAGPDIPCAAAPRSRSQWAASTSRCSPGPRRYLTPLMDPPRRTLRRPVWDKKEVCAMILLRPGLGLREACGAQAELIPLDSVRVSKGGDFEEEETQDTLFDAYAARYRCALSQRAHRVLTRVTWVTWGGRRCLEYNAPTSSENVVFDADSKAVFDSRLNDQSCAPDADMCVSPATIPDSFVSFNIPLGIDWLPEEDNSLANNVFVHLVVTAEDKIARGSGMSPNSGSAPWQMKTTLFASIPVVQGGRQ
eukprot:2244717-Rhodomonas_salina.1